MCLMNLLSGAAGTTWSEGKMACRRRNAIKRFSARCVSLMTDAVSTGVLCGRLSIAEPNKSHRQHTAMRTNPVVCPIFERLNSSGSILSPVVQARSTNSHERMQTAHQLALFSISYTVTFHCSIKHTCNLELWSRHL